MNKDFIPYEQALELRHLGYDYESSFYYTYGYDGYYVNYGEYNYTNDHWMFNADDNKNRHLLCVAPLYQQAFRWFREKYDLLCYIKEYKEDDDFISYEAVIQTHNGYYGCFGNTYEKAELACLKKLIEIAKNK